MKKLLILFAALLLCSGCDEKKNEDTKVVVTQVEKPKATQDMQNYDLSDTLTIAGHKYEFTITRRPDNSQPKIKVESGGDYHENQIHLVIKSKSDGSVFLDKEFTKEYFAFGIVYDYDKADDHSKFYFAASVGDPEDDEMLFPIKMTISPSGSINIEKDNLIDEVPDDGGMTTIDPSEDQG